MPGRYAGLSVSDTGHGIPADIQRHLFEPFFTTKPADKGTGLGLSIVYGIVKDSGPIELQSELGQGATFTIYLPLVIDAAQRCTFTIEHGGWFPGSNDGLMGNTRRYHHKRHPPQPSAVSHLTCLPSANFAVARVLRFLDAAAIQDGGFSTLNNEDVRPVLVKLSCTASIAPQNLEL